MSRQLIVKRPNAFWWNASKFCVMCFAKVWFRLRFEGREHIPTTGPVIVVANHASYIDPPMVGIGVPRYLLFLAQAGLARFGPARWWMARVGVTLIDRDAPSKDALRILSDSLKAGYAVCIFPEGTRTKDGKVAPFRNGVEFLVRRTGAPVLPAGIDGSGRAMPRSAWLPRPRKVVVRYGELWSAERVLADKGSEELRRHVAQLAHVEVSDRSARVSADSRSSSDPVLSTPPISPSAESASESQSRQSS